VDDEQKREYLKLRLWKKAEFDVRSYILLLITLSPGSLVTQQGSVYTLT